MEISTIPFSFDLFFARYLCGGEALKDFRLVSRTQIALANCKIGYFEPKAVNLAIDITRFSGSIDHLLSKGLNKLSLCETNSYIRKIKQDNNYRAEEIWIGKNKKKAKFIPPEAKKIERLMDDWILRANQEKLLVEDVFEIYAQFLLIHPFTDGNGRTGRIILQSLFKKHRLSHLPPDLYRLKNIKKSCFIEQVQSYTQSNQQEKDGTFLNDWLSWEGKCREQITQQIQKTNDEIEQRLLLTPLNPVQKAILNLLWKQPVLSEKMMTDELGVAKAQIKDSIHLFKRANILEEKRTRTKPDTPLLMATLILELCHRIDDLLFTR